MDFTTISFQVVFSGGRSDVSVFVKIPFDFSVNGCEHHVMPDIEFTFLIEKRSLDVALDDVGFGTTIGVLLLFFDDDFNFFEGQTHLDSISSVRVFARLYNPGVVIFAILISLLLIRFFYVFTSFVVILEELIPAVILKPVFDMESQW